MNFLVYLKEKTPHDPRNTQINGWIWQHCGEDVSFRGGGGGGDASATGALTALARPSS